MPFFTIEKIAVFPFVLFILVKHFPQIESSKNEKENFLSDKLTIQKARLEKTNKKFTQFLQYWQENDLKN